MCGELLANPLIESYEIEAALGGLVTKPRARIAVIVFPGSNDDRDAALALEGLGADPVLVWHADRELPRGRGRRSPRRVLLRRLPPRRRDRTLLTGDAGRSPTSPAKAGSCSASATASRSSAKPGSCPEPCARTTRSPS